VSDVRARVLRRSGVLSSPLSSARGQWARREGLVLELRDEGGLSGRGEASPRPGYSPESLDDCAQALARWQPGDDVGPLPGAARCAVDAARLDLEGHRRALPAWRLLAAGDAPRVALAALLSGDSEADWRASAERALSRGVRTLKAKVGRPGRFAEELSALRAIRALAGDAVALRLDANGCWAPAAARERLRALAEIAPEFVEEPVAGGDLDALGEPPVPLALDESLLSPRAAFPRHAAVAVLKPMLLGGPRACFALARSLVAAGIDLTVSHTWDGPLGLAAAAATAFAIAAAWPGRLRACGLSPHAGLSAWPAVKLDFLDETHAAPSLAPGLGVPAMDLG
jgi:o-succinylbenzoate synthase